MMISLKLAGKLDAVKAIIVGGMTDMKDNKVKFGTSAEEIIATHVQPYNIPVCYGFPAGHIDDNRAMVFGRKVQLQITSKGTLLSYQ
jgi:muramoyltetrapeptide carboxypeptidase